MTRREFIIFMGASAASHSFLSGCQSSAKNQWVFQPIPASDKDDLILAEGFTKQILISEMDPLKNDELFGTNNDYTSFMPLDSSGTEALLWVNHEYFNPLFVTGFHPSNKNFKRTKEQVDKEQSLMGGSVLHIRKTKGQWVVDTQSSYTQRYSAQRSFELIAPRKIQGTNKAVGMVANCAGGQTPWGTFLSCEENFDNFYGNVVFKDGQRQVVRKRKKESMWLDFYNHPSEHYGWVCEIDPKKKTAKKLTALGRFAHESATVHPLPDGRVVVYSGDDKADQCLYRFISEKPNSLETGELFVADIENGKWISLDRESQPRLQKAFTDQTELLIRCREAAKIVGGTPLDRPEDVEIHPKSGEVFVALTNNKKRGNLHGSILKIAPKDGDHTAEHFSASTFIAGGEETGFSCPDNLAFDKKGNLWICCDVSTGSMNKGEYAPFKNNGLFYVPLTGPHAGKAHRVASGPTDSELTGLSFADDGETLFLSVQHPGESSKSLNQLTSGWPEFNGKPPKSSVVVLSGPTLKQLLA
tara:strand:+ start:24832 stop:26415 length:1584 start_codon:yes stop_codon:yes gene_type:complete